MIGLGMLQRELAVGRRWVTAMRITTTLNGIERIEDPEIETIVGFDAAALALGHNIVVTLQDRQGMRREIVMCHTGIIVGKGHRRVLWTDPLPDDDDLAIALVGAAFMAPDKRRSTLLWVAAVEGDRAYTHMVTDDGHLDDATSCADGCMATASTTRILTPTETLAPGTLVAIAGTRATYQDGLHLHAPKAMMVIAAGMTLADVRAIPVAPRRKCHFVHGNFAGGYDLDEEEGWGIARSEPSEAIVLVYDDTGTMRTTVLWRTGVAFHHQEDVEVYLEDQIPGPGLWSYANAKMMGYRSYEGEYDQELSGDVAPADIRLIERIFADVASLEAEIVSQTGEHIKAQTLIDQARAAVDHSAAVEIAAP